MVSADVVIRFEGTKKALPPEETKTTAVSADGALILLRTSVRVGERLLIKNVSTEEHLPCKVVDLGSISESGIAEVGLKFVEPHPNFWRIAFPPANWLRRSLEARSRKAKLARSPKPK